MLRFDRLIRPSMTMREVKVEHAKTTKVFETFGFRDACDDCAIEVVARKHGLSAADVVDALNDAILHDTES